jgi:adenylate cyclase
VPLLVLWVTLENGFRDALPVYPSLAVLIVLILAPYLMRRSGRDTPWLNFVLPPLYAGLLTYIVVTPRSSDPPNFPLALYLTFGNEAYLYILVSVSVFTFSPAVILWTGVTTAGAWSVVTLWALYQPGAIGDIPNAVWLTMSPEEQLRIVTDPHRVHVGRWIRQVLSLLIVSGNLAAFVRMSRGLVFRQAAAERERANLSRYFSANLVEDLARADEPLGATRAQDAAVLFADIVGFTALSEKRRPEEVIALLREFHGRMERAVFEHDGTVDKYIGDAIMATFGTPATRDDDPVRALRCARAMVASLEQWNGERARRGEVVLRIGIGIHYGPVVLGDIGGEQRMEFAVIGDTVNVASRLERLTRELGARVVVSDALVAAVRACAGNAAPELAGFELAGAHGLRGRGAPIEVWRWSSAGA